MTADKFAFWNPSDPLTDDLIAGTYRVFQRKNGHRFSLDDVATAWEGANTKPHATKYLDIGCGIGSVLHMVSWKLQSASVVGVEAQEQSFQLVTHSVARNVGLTNRVTLIHGDLRDPEIIARALSHGPFELITGTPPYMPLGTSTPSPDSQRAHARVELRGGIEAYLASAAQLLSDDGRFVVCCDARATARAENGARDAGMTPLRKRDVMPRANLKDPLFSIWTFAKKGTVPSAPYEIAEPLVVRDAEGARTMQAHAMREFFDIAPNRDEPASP